MTSKAKVTAAREKPIKPIVPNQHMLPAREKPEKPNKPKKTQKQKKTKKTIGTLIWGVWGHIVPSGLVFWVFLFFPEREACVDSVLLV